MTQVYNYDRFTKEFLYVTTGEPDPVDGHVMLPAFSTTQEPPNTSVNEVACFESGSWVVKPDHRGVTYWLSHDVSMKIDEIGVTVPDEAVTQQPDAPVVMTDLTEVTLLSAGVQVSQCVTALAGNPSPVEIASWSEKMIAAREALSSGNPDLVILKPTMTKYDVDASGAGEIIILRSRLHRLAKASFDMMFDTFSGVVALLVTPDEVRQAEADFNEDVIEKMGELQSLYDVVKSGNANALTEAENLF